MYLGTLYSADPRYPKVARSISVSSIYSHLTQTQDTQTQKSPSQNNALINETAPKSNPDTAMRHSPSNPPALHTPTYYHMQLRGARLIHSHILRTPDGVLRNCSVFRTVDRGQRGLRRTGINPTSDHTCKSNISGSCASHVWQSPSPFPRTRIISSGIPRRD